MRESKETTDQAPESRSRRQRLRDKLQRYQWLVGVLATLCVGLGVLTAVMAVAPDEEVDRGPDLTDETEVVDTLNLGTGLAGVGVNDDPNEEAEPEPEEPIAAEGASEEGRDIAGGEASYYGGELAGRPTASGETFNPGAMTAAHRTLPFGTRVRVTNLNNDRSVVVRINDRGPFARQRVIDLSEEAARRIGMLGSGHARVRLQVLK